MRVLPILLVLLCVASPVVADDTAPLWAALRAGGHVALIRHAATVGGAGDPQGFRLDDCATQRNLTDKGRAQARRLGERFRAEQAQQPTPQCHDGDEPTVRQTEGPYFKPSSPQRTDLVEPGSKARLVEITGQVLTRTCRPVPALIDLWHADERGAYDNAGFRYRGHLFTDAEGRYRFRTILPALYNGRTRHYHVKVQAADRAVLTTQLYFPADEAANRRDGLFRRELLMRVAEAGDGLAARFDFILDIR